MKDKIFDNLVTRYNKTTLTVDELASEMGLSREEIDNFLDKGICLPSYMVLEDKSNTIILFPITYVARFMALSCETNKVSIHHLV